MKRLVLILVPLFLFQFLGAAGDQVDLAKLKKQLEEQRKKLKKSKYKVSNQNLLSIEVPEKQYALSQMGITQVSETPATPAGRTDRKKKEDPTVKEEYWRDLKKNLDEEIKKIREKIATEQLELNDLTTRFLSMELPLQRSSLRDQIETMTSQIAADQARLADLEQEVARLPERARKAGVPPGWVR